MKNLFLLLFILVCVGCSKSSNNTTTTTPPVTKDTTTKIYTQRISAKINGKVWSATIFSCSKYFSNPNYTFDLTGSTMPADIYDTVLNFSISNCDLTPSISSKSYSLTHTSANIKLLVFGTPLYATSGTLSIDTIKKDVGYDSYITGRFNFNSDSLAVTEGVFTIGYPAF